MTDDQLARLADVLADAVAARVGLQPATPRLVSASAVADMLDVQKSWVLAEARSERIPHVRLGRYVRFDPERVAAWWASKETSA